MTKTYVYVIVHNNVYSECKVTNRVLEQLTTDDYEYDADTWDLISTSSI